MYKEIVPSLITPIIIHGWQFLNSFLIFEVTLKLIQSITVPIQGPCINPFKAQNVY